MNIDQRFTAVREKYRNYAIDDRAMATAELLLIQIENLITQPRSRVAEKLLLISEMMTGHD